MSISQDRAVAYTRLCRDHIETLLEIERACYPDPWTPGMFLQEISGAASHFYVLHRENTIMGYAGFWLLLDEAHITKITVADPWRGQGFGQEMLEFLTGRAIAVGATSMRLEVRSTNVEALKLYNRNGFREVGIRKGYYARSGEDALVMVKWIG